MGDELRFDLARDHADPAHSLVGLQPPDGTCGVNGRRPQEVGIHLVPIEWG